MTDPDRMFRPCQQVEAVIDGRGWQPACIVGSMNTIGEYAVHIEGVGSFDLPAASIRVPGEQWPCQQLEFAGTSRDRLRQAADTLRDWQAKLPRMIRDIDDALKQ